MDFTPPTTDQVLALRVSAGIEELAAHERFEAASPDLVEAIVEGIGALAAGEWAPLNRLGDTEGAKWSDGTVTLPAGFADAYSAFVEQMRAQEHARASAHAALTQASARGNQLVPTQLTILA